MSYEIKILPPIDWPPLLLETPKPPAKLYYAGTIPDYSRKFLCVVGSRKYTSYGRDAVEYLIKGLTGYPVTIVSGLALGIDSFAHINALKYGLPTIAIPGSGLNPKALHPQSHLRLAEEIAEKGGALLSEFEPDFKATFWSFPQRNRIMAGISHATLLIEAGEKSGTLITAKLATDYNRELLCVPGPIFSTNSEGTNMFARLGATIVRSAEDILEALKIPSTSSGQVKYDYSDCSANEIKIIKMLNEPLERDELVRKTKLPIHEIQMALTLLELKGYIKEEMGEVRLVK
ncbi:MAG: DNA-processing protein DprA [Patescibacteria group bacterium]